MNDNIKLMTKICKLYYYESWTQEKIAEKFGISRPIISKMIQKAREIGVVEIIVHDDPQQTTELEKELEMAYQLQQVLVVPTRDLNKELVTSAVGKAAAQFVQKLIKNGDRIGVSWGNSLYHMVREFPLDKKDDVKIIPLIGEQATNGPRYIRTKSPTSCPRGLAENANRCTHHRLSRQKNCTNRSSGCRI